MPIHDSSLPMDGSPSDEAAWLVPDADAPGPWRPFSILPLTTGPQTQRHLKSWRASLAHSLFSHRLHIVMGILLALDAICVIAGMELQIQALLRERDRCTKLLPADHVVEWLESAEAVVVALGISILAAFLVELALMVVVLGRQFFGSVFLMLDLLVVLLSLAQEVLELLGMVTDYPAVLVLFRVWRFARVAHGTYKEEEEGNLEHNLRLPSDAAKVTDD